MLIELKEVITAVEEQLDLPKDQRESLPALYDFALHVIYGLGKVDEEELLKYGFKAEAGEALVLYGLITNLVKQFGK